MKKASTAIRYTKTDRVFLGFVWTVLSLFLLILVYPLAYVLVSSFSSIPITGIALIPKNPSLAGYQAVIEYKYIWQGYANSLKYMAVGTAISLVVTICCAYPLSRKDFFLGKPMMFLCIFTMYFGGGLIPSFLLVKDLGMIDTIWALVLPGALSVYNMIVMRTYFQNSIPGELHEAAQLDGCNDYRFVWFILLPLSGPILAVIGMYYAVGHWNSYFSALVYIRTRSKLPLTMILREILVLNQASGVQANISEQDMELLSRMEERALLMKYSLIIVASLPMLALYPFVQKYFVKGVMIGAVKG